MGDTLSPSSQNNNNNNNNNEAGNNNEGNNDEGNNNEGNNNEQGNNEGDDEGNDEGNNDEGDNDEPEPETKLTEPIKKGAKILQVETEADVKVGAPAVIDVGTEIEEENEIKSFGSLILAKPLKFAHPAGAKVTIMSSKGNNGRRRRTSGNARRRRSSGNDDGDEFDFGEDEPLDEEKPGTHLGGIRKLVGGVVDKSIGKVANEISDIAKAIKKLDANKADISKELKPLEEGLEDVKDTVKDAKKVRESIIKKVGDVTESVEDLTKVKNEMKNVAQKKDLDGLEKDLKGDVSGAKGLFTRGINKLGKVATQTHQYLKQIYSDIHALK